MSLTQEQIDNRLNFVTGSDIAVICGLSPWGNIVDLWRYKCRLAVAPDISGSPFVNAGQRLEPVVVQWFEDATGKQIKRDNEFIIHPTHKFMGGNIDGFIESENAIFEAKTSMRGNDWGLIGDNTIPDYYLLQVAHYVACKDAERAYIAALIGGWDFRCHYTYERNLKLEEMVVGKVKEFWDCVKNEVPPVPRTSEEVLSYYEGFTDQTPVIANCDIQEAVDKLAHIKGVIKDFEDQKTKLEERIKVYMGAKDMLLGLNGKMAASWKMSKESEKFDEKKFKSENEELYGKYVSTKPGHRTFLLKKG